MFTYKAVPRMPPPLALPRLALLAGYANVWSTPMEFSSDRVLYRSIGVGKLPRILRALGVQPQGGGAGTPIRIIYGCSA